MKQLSTRTILTAIAWTTTLGKVRLLPWFLASLSGRCGEDFLQFIQPARGDEHNEPRALARAIHCLVRRFYNTDDRAG